MLDNQGPNKTVYICFQVGRSSTTGEHRLVEPLSWKVTLVIDKLLNKKPDFKFIDCARGYAILLVILCHLKGRSPNLPYPVARVVSQGWFGVQLFFMASAMTLMMSWAYREGRPSISYQNFLLRRFLRIAPMFYLGIPLYLVLMPPPAGTASIEQLLATLSFVSSWKPYWVSTLDGGWMAVPGQWSISDEFCFYLIFPVLASLISNIKRAAVAVVAALGIAFVGNLAWVAFLGHGLSGEPKNNFLYFWPINQLFVFALGIGVFHLWRHLAEDRMAGVRAMLRRWSVVIASVAMIGALTTSFYTEGHWIGDGLGVPAFVIATVSLAIFLIALSQSGFPLVNSVVGTIGKVSFSAYILHFGVLALVSRYLSGPLGLHTTGYRAIAFFTLDYFIVVALTVAFANLTYSFVEKPFIRLAARLTTSRR